jgi:hypothetical protein
MIVLTDKVDYLCRNRRLSRRGATHKVPRLGQCHCRFELVDRGCVPPPEQSREEVYRPALQDETE